MSHNPVWLIYGCYVSLVLAGLTLIPLKESTQYVEGVLAPKKEHVKRTINPFKSIIRLFTTSKYVGFYALLYFSYSYTSQDATATSYNYTFVKFNWGFKQNGMNLGTVGFCLFIWSSLVVPFALKFISGRVMICIGFLVSSVFHVIYALVDHPWEWTTAMCFGCFSVILLNVLLSVISRATPHDIQGSVMAGVAALSSISAFSGAIASSNIFAYFVGPHTPYYFPGYLADLTNKDSRAVWFGVIGSAIGVSITVGPLIGMLLIGTPAWVIYAGYVSLGLAGITIIPLKESIHYVEGVLVPAKVLVKRSINPFKSIIRLFTTSKYVGYYALLYFSFSYTSQDSVATSYMYTLLKYGWGPKQNGISTAIIGPFIFLWSAAFLPFALKYTSDRVLLCYGFLASSIFHAAYAFAANQWEWYASQCLGSFSVIILNLVQSVISRATPADIQGSVLSGVASLASAASFVGALASSNIFAYFVGPHTPLYFPGYVFPSSPAFNLYH
eukprot:gene3676-4231_t